MRGILLVALLGSLSASAAPAESPDPSARLPSGSSAWEDWSLTVQLESGHRVFARFIVTNQGPGSQNAIVLGHLVTPDGTPHLFKNGRRQGRWELAEDRRGLDVGSSDLELRDPIHLRITKDSVKIDLEMHPRAGASLPRTALPRGYHVDLLDPAAATRGTVWVPSMAAPVETRGVTGIVHSWAEDEEKSFIARRLDTFNAPAGRPFYALRLDTRRGPHTWVASVSQDGRLVGCEVQSVLEGHARLDEKPKHGMPGAEILAGPQATGRIEFGKQVLGHDPSGVIPLALRWFLRGSLPYRVWAESGFDVTLCGGFETDSLHARGQGVTVGTFLEPVARPHDPQ